MLQGGPCHIINSNTKKKIALDGGLLGGCGCGGGLLGDEISTWWGEKCYEPNSEVERGVGKYLVSVSLSNIIRLAILNSAWTIN